MLESLAKIAVYWDQSFLWGLLAYGTLRRLGADFELLTAADIRLGRLEDYGVVFVPGGWASDKMGALGQKGAARIRSFVEEGGAYLGVCGGAGLALTHASGLGLAPLGRLPSSVRVPSFSGLIHLDQEDRGHPVWRDIPGGIAFYAWWPGQFALDEEAGVKVLARYGQPEESASFVTDIPVTADSDWDNWEKSYGINLNPARLLGEPAVIETGAGKGKVLLSYLHFETPGDLRGHKVLLNAIGYLSGKRAAGRAGAEGVWAGAKGAAAEPQPPSPAAAGAQKRDSAPAAMPAAALASEIHQEIAGLIEFGHQNFLLRWREQPNLPILVWRRGVRGIEYSTLFAMTAEINRLAGRFPEVASAGLDRLKALKEMTPSFCADARRLLLLERLAISNGPLSPLKSSDPAIEPLREKLFSTAMRSGGLYRQIVDTADEVLLPLLRKGI